MHIKELKTNAFLIKNNSVYLQNIKGPGMLLIHAEWCGYCKRFMPLFQNLNKKIGNNFSCVAIENSELENSHNLSNALNFKYFPTIKFFDQYGKIIDTYPDNLPRDEENLLQYICNVYHHCIEKH